jgi:hypothetical protein
MWRLRSWGSNVPADFRELLAESDQPVEVQLIA